MNKMAINSLWVILNDLFLTSQKKINYSFINKTKYERQ